MGTLLHLPSKMTTDEAWERYISLVTERADKNLWTDIEHNKRIAHAWDAWSSLYLAEARKS